MSISINAPFDEVYEFAHQPMNFPKWAQGLGDNIRVGMGGIWLADTPLGPAEIKFSPKNEYGILDHSVRLLSGTVEVPLRLIKNGSGTEIVFTLFRQEDMSDTAYAEDMAAVARDLMKLKTLLEGDQSSVVHVDFHKRV